MIEPMTYTGGMAMTNGYLLRAPGGLVLVDAPEGIGDWLRSRDLRPDLILVTHQHYDHVQDAAAVAAWAGCPLWAHAPYAKDLTLENYLQAAGWPVAVEPFEVGRLLAGGTAVDVAGWVCEVSHVPGHATDALVFHFPAAGLVFSGDTLFASGVGRTDLPMGSWDQLLDGIRRHLLTLPDETTVYPGHGGPTTIGVEKEENPYLS